MCTQLNIQFSSVQLLSHVQLFVFSHKNMLLFLIMWMNLEDILLNEISQTEKDNYHMATLTCEIENKPAKLTI